MNQNEIKKGKEEPAKEPRVPIMVPLSLLRWLVYSATFAALLIPFTKDPWQLVCGGLILGWFAGQLNALIHKK